MARAGLRLVMFEERSMRMSEDRAAREVSTWAEVMRGYRVILFEQGGERMRDVVRKRAGMTWSVSTLALSSGTPTAES